MLYIPLDNPPKCEYPIPPQLNYVLNWQAREHKSLQRQVFR